MRWGVPILALCLALAAGALGGVAPFGRIALGLGMPDLAARLFDDPAWRGVALYRAGRFQQAAAALADAGPQAAFNLGNALAQGGRYAAALEAYDVALAHRADPAAQANFDLVLAFYGGTRIDADSIALWGEDRDGPTVQADVARGAARASGTGDETTNTGATIGLPELQGGEQRGVRKVFDDKFVVASPRWLATLEDVPGAFVAARISHEHKRRKKAGEGQPQADSPW